MGKVISINIERIGPRSEYDRTPEMSLFRLIIVASYGCPPQTQTNEVILNREQARSLFNDMLEMAADDALRD